MNEDKYITIRIERVVDSALNDLAKKDARSKVREIQWLIESELNRRDAPDLETYRALFIRSPKVQS